MTSRLDRFEDAERFRERLLALQVKPLPGQPTKAEKVLEKHQARRKKKSPRVNRTIRTRSQRISPKG